MATRKSELETKQSLGQFWLGEIDQAGKSFNKWQERGEKVIRRYRDERDISEGSKRKFNILWSNTQVMKPALYGRAAKPEVTRRFKDQDPVGRTAATMLERCLEYEVEQYPDFDHAMNGAVEDRLLPGRGIAWVRFEQPGGENAQVSEDVDASVPRAEYECAPADYVYWKDFLHTPARTWEEVWWVARRVYMTREELRQRFKDKAELVPLQHDKGMSIEKETPKDALKKKAEVWEIWDKTEKKVVWVAKGYDTELDVREDPLQLQGFFPCPKPLYSTITTGSTVPIPDYCEYQDQAEELDIITQRISKLTKAIKRAGIYNAEFPELKRLLSETVDNDMIASGNWAAFAEKAGIEGATQFLPIKETADALAHLYEAREQVKQVIYETIGISDIIRGATKSEETLGAQQLKASFGSMRMRQSQGDVARFATDILKAKAQIICRFFRDETIIAMSGVMATPDAPLAQQALQLLRQGPVRDFRIQVEADSLAQLDEQQEKADRIEFLTASGTFLKEAVPVIQMAPQVGPLLGEMLLFGVRAFRVGRTIEAAFDKAMAALGQQPGGNPQEMQAQQEQLQQGMQELARQKDQLQQEGMKLRDERVAFEADKQVYDIAKMADKAIADAQMKAMHKDAEGLMTKFDAHKEKRAAEVKQIDAETEEKLPLVEHLSEIMNTMRQAASAMAEAAQTISAAADKIAKPKQVVRDKNNRIVALH